MTASFADWPRFFALAYENLAPGAWSEIADVLPPTSDDASLSPGTSLHRFSALLLEGTQKIGRGFDCALNYREQTEAAMLMSFKPDARWPRCSRGRPLAARLRVGHLAVMVAPRD